MWGILPNSSTTTNGNAVCSGLPVIALNECYTIIGNTTNNGGTAWANINFYYTNGNIVGNAWINGTGKLQKCNYHLIGI